uniref:Uncharacterized protein n=2 Tax=Dunaliella tertiolecta TaxID=3047 RepID=A0A7S3R2C8_DUNTE
MGELRRSPRGYNATHGMGVGVDGLHASTDTVLSTRSADRHMHVESSAAAAQYSPRSPRARVGDSPRSSSGGRGSAADLHLSADRNPLLSSASSSARGSLPSASPLSRSMEALTPRGLSAPHDLLPSPLRRSHDSNSSTRASALAALYRLQQQRPPHRRPLGRSSADRFLQGKHPSTSSAANSRQASSSAGGASTSKLTRPHDRTPIDPDLAPILRHSTDHHPVASRPDLAPILRRSSDLPLARNSRGGSTSRSSAARVPPPTSTSSSVSSSTTKPPLGLPRPSKPTSAFSGLLSSDLTHGPSLKDPLPAAAGTTTTLHSYPPSHFLSSRATSASASTTSLHTMEHPPQQHSAFTLYATGAGGRGGGVEGDPFMTSSWPPHGTDEVEGTAEGPHVRSSSGVSPFTLAASSARSRSVDCLNRPASASLDFTVTGFGLRPSSYVGSTQRRAMSQAVGNYFRPTDQHPHLRRQQRSASYSGEAHPYLFFGDRRASNASSMGWGAYPNWDTNREFGPLTREQRPKPASRQPQPQEEQAPPPKSHLPSFLFLKSEARRLAQLEAKRAEEAAAHAEAAAAEAKQRRAAAAEEALQEVERKAAAGRLEEANEACVSTQEVQVDEAGAGAGAKVQDEGVSGAQQLQDRARNAGQKEEREGEQGHTGRAEAEEGKRHSRSIGRTLGRKLSTLFGGGGASRKDGNDQ